MDSPAAALVGRLRKLSMAMTLIITRLKTLSTRLGLELVSMGIGTSKKSNIVPEKRRIPKD